MRHTVSAFATRTHRGNITFGKPYDEAFYKQVGASPSPRSSVRVIRVRQAAPPSLSLSLAPPPASRHATHLYAVVGLLGARPPPSTAPFQSCTQPHAHVAHATTTVVSSVPPFFHTQPPQLISHRPNVSSSTPPKPISSSFALPPQYTIVCLGNRWWPPAPSSPTWPSSPAGISARLGKRGSTYRSVPFF